MICEKVARYAERVHHPDRLARPLRRKGAKGGGETQVGFCPKAVRDISVKYLQHLADGLFGRAVAQCAVGPIKMQTNVSRECLFSSHGVSWNSCDSGRGQCAHARARKKRGIAQAMPLLVPN